MKKICINDAVYSIKDSDFQKFRNIPSSSKHDHDFWDFCKEIQEKYKIFCYIDEKVET